jgi:hypothetical protein
VDPESEIVTLSDDAFPLLILRSAPRWPMIACEIVSEAATGAPAVTVPPFVGTVAASAAMG